MTVEERNKGSIHLQIDVIHALELENKSKNSICISVHVMVRLYLYYHLKLIFMLLSSESSQPKHINSFRG